MTFLRFLALLALALWIGGLVALGGIAASALFTALEAQYGGPGRELAAAIFGQMFQRAQYGAWIAGAMVLMSLAGRAALGPRPKRFGLRMWVSAGMLAASVTSVFLIAPRIEQLRAASGGPVASLPDQDPRRIAFGRWHALSTGLVVLTIAAGIGLIWTEAADS